MLSAWEGWNKVQESIYIPCWVYKILQGGLPGKRECWLAWMVPRSNILLPNADFTPLCWTSAGIQSVGKNLWQVLAAAVILSGVTFLSGPNAGLLGSFLCPCQLSAELPCSKHTWHSSRAVTWTWRMEGGLVLLVDQLGLWLPSFLGNTGPFLLLCGSKC